MSQHTKSRCTIRQCFWIVILVSGITLFSLHTYTLINDLINPSISVEFHPKSKPFPTPDILFCFETIFSSSSIVSSKNKEIFNEIKNLSNIFDEKFRIKLYDFESEFSQFLFSNINLTLLFNEFHHKRTELIQYIKCGGKKIPEDKIAFEFNYNHFYCLRIKSQDCDFYKNPYGIQAKFYIHKYPQYKEIEENELMNQIHKMFFLQPVSIDGSENVYIYFDNNKEFDIDIKNRARIISGHEIDVFVDSTIYELKPKKNQTCYDIWKNEFYYGLVTGFDNIEYNSHSVCPYIEFQQYVNDTLQCYLINYPINIPWNQLLSPIFYEKSELSFCHNIKNYLTTQENINFLSKMLESKDLYSQCQNMFFTCKLVDYSLRINIASKLDLNKQYDYYYRYWTENCPVDGECKAVPGIARSLKNKSEKFLENIYLVNIIPTSQKVTFIKEEYSYKFYNFFSDIVGMAGFYLGFSLVTIYQLSEFICQLFKRKTKETQQDNDNNNNEALENLNRTI